MKCREEAKGRSAYLETSHSFSPDFDVVFFLSSFKIDLSSGVITVKSPLDRESQAEFSLTVVAKDSGTPFLSASVVVRVIIDDVNDNAPVFSQQMFYGSIREDASSGSTVLKVSRDHYKVKSEYKIIMKYQKRPINPNVVEALKSVDETLVCDHLNESY